MISALQAYLVEGNWKLFELSGGEDVALVASHNSGEIYSVSWDRYPRAQRCEGIVGSTGEQCSRWAIRGATVCYHHSGGDLPGIREEAEKTVERARVLMASATEQVADALVNLALDERVAPYIRIKAAAEVLDRSGLPRGSHVTLDANVSDPAHESAAEVVRSRIQRLATMTQLPTSEPGTDVVLEGELEEPTDAPEPA